MRSRSQLLGVVYAPDEKSAEAAAIAEFKIGEDMRLQPRLKDITAQCCLGDFEAHAEALQPCRERPAQIV